MKIEFTYSKLIKTSLFLFFVLIFYTAVFFFFTIFNINENLSVQSNCILKSKNSSECVFSCNTRADCRNSITQRVMVLYSGTISIFDRIQNVSCGQSNTIIDLPNRNYTYEVRFLMFDNNDYGKSDGILSC